MFFNGFPPTSSSDSCCGCPMVPDSVPTTGPVPHVLCSKTMRVRQQQGSTLRCYHQTTGCLNKNKNYCTSCVTIIKSRCENECSREGLSVSACDSQQTFDFRKACLSRVRSSFKINIANGIAGYISVILLVFVTCMSLTSAQSCSNSNSIQVIECNCSTDSAVVNTCNLTNVTTDLCGKVVCQNNATCDVDVNSSHGNQVAVNCTCNHGYTGEFCESLINYCANVSCQNGSHCFSDHSNFTFKCICQPGWTDVQCDKKIPCNETAESCNNIYISPERNNCTEGYEGVNCSTPNCSLVNCMNGGNCSIAGDEWFCNCTEFYNGTYCELEMNECETEPCKNNGSCHNFDGGYNCTCLDGYSGRNCENYNSCHSSPCKNNATCLNFSDSYNCSCQHGYHGDFCQFYDICSSSPCYHNGICSNDSSSYICSCQPGYYGNRCESFDNCFLTPCFNNGTCHNFIDAYNCSCLPGFQGINCSEIDSCHSLPCNNNGTCRNSGDGTYRCACLSGYEGTDCQIIDPCVINSPCSNSGSCLRINSSCCVTGSCDPLNCYECNCLFNYTGVHCETLKTLNNGNNNNDQVGLIVGLTVGLFFLVVIIVVTVILIVIIIQKRKNLGTYHPNRQELAGARMDFNNVLKPPPEERLI